MSFYQNALSALGEIRPRRSARRPGLASYLIAFSLIFFALAATSAMAQATSPAADAKQLAAFQANLTTWEQTLTDMDFGTWGLDSHWVDGLNQERGICPETMKTENEIISSLQKEPTLTREFLLTSNASRLQVSLGSLLDFITLSYWYFPQGTGNEVLSLNLQHQVIEMASGTEEAWEGFQSRLVEQLSAIDKNGVPQMKRSAAPPPNGQISGHIYRADNGKPLPGVIVTLDPSGTGIQRSKRTARGGSYRFSDVAPGSYWVTAYATGFVGSLYGAKSPPFSGESCPPSCVSLASGQKVGAIDLRLIAAPPITSLDKQLAAMFPIEWDHLNPGIGRFSPDGKYFAIALTTNRWGGVFLYDLRSRKLTQGADTGGFLAWSADGTLYIQGSHDWTVTSSGTKELTDFPPEIKAAFQQGLNGEPSNDQYVVTSPRLCRGCPFTLTAKRTDGSGEQVIADITRNFVLDGKNSIVFYPDGNEIVMFDIVTRETRKIELPVEAQDLIDQTQDRTGHLVAYYANAPCEPDAASEEAESQLLIPGNAKLRRQQPPAIHVCFVKFP